MMVECPVEEEGVAETAMFYASSCLEDAEEDMVDSLDTMMTVFMILVTLQQL